MIDRTYPKIVVVCYPAGAGGNFLVNCLSLTDQCVLRNRNLAAKQLDGNLTSDDKLKFFQSELVTSRQTKKWRDLGVTNIDFFGVGKTSYLEEYAEIIEDMFDPIVGTVIGADKYMFIICHTTQYLDAYKKFWPKAKVIVFTEYHRFVRQRGYDKDQNTIQRLKQYWQDVKGYDWPDDPPMTRDDLFSLPLFVKEELLGTMFQKGILKYLDYVPTRQILHDQTINLRIKSEHYFEWSVEKNFSGDQHMFLDNLNACAKWLGIRLEIDNQLLGKFYSQWLDTIFHIVKFSQPGEPG